jgi:hypothetical protein
MTGPAINPLDKEIDEGNQAAQNPLDAELELEQKKNQLLPVDSTATAPQTNMERVEGVPPPEPPRKKIGEGYPRAKVDVGPNATPGQKGGAILWYGYNRALDAAFATINSINESIPIFKDLARGMVDPTHKTMAAKAVEQTYEGAKIGVGHFREAMARGQTKEYLKKDFAQETVVKPLVDMATRVVMTPLKLAVIEPFYIALEGYQRTPDAILQKDYEEVVPDLAMLWATGYMGRVVAEAQTASILARGSGALGKEFASNAANITSREMAIERIISLPIEDMRAMKASLPISIKAANLATKWVAEAAAGGVAYGLTMQGTPEEKTNAIVQMGIYTLPFIAMAHPVGWAIGKGVSKTPIINRLPVLRDVGKPSQLEMIQDVADKTLKFIQVADLMKLPYSERASMFAKFAQGLDLSDILARHVPRGIIMSVTPEIRKSLGEHGFIYHDRGDGRFNVLVDRTKYVDPAAYAEYPDGANERADAMHKQAMDEAMTALQLTDPYAAAEIQALLDEGLVELAATKLKLRDNRSYYNRAVNADPETGASNRRSLDSALPKAEADPNVTILAHDLASYKVLGKEVLGKFIEHVKKVFENNGVKWRDTFMYGGDQLVTLLEDNQNPALVQKIKSEIDAFSHTIDEGTPTEGVATVRTGSGSNLDLADADLGNIRAANGVTAATPFRQSAAFFTPAEQAHFKQHGFVPLQKVMYNGSFWYIHDIANKTVKLVDQEGNTTVTNVSKLQRTPDLEVGRAADVADVNTILNTPIDEANIPKEPGFQTVRVGEIRDLGPEPVTEGSSSYMDEAGLTEAIEKARTSGTAGNRATGELSVPELQEALKAAKDFAPFELVTKTLKELINDIAKLTTGDKKGSVYNRQGVQRILTELQSHGRLDEAGNAFNMFNLILNKMYENGVSINKAKEILGDAIERHTDSGYKRDLANIPIDELIDFAPTQISRFSPEGIVSNISELVTQAMNELETKRVVTPRVFHYIKAFMNAWEKHKDGGSLERLHREVTDNLRTLGHDVLDNDVGNIIDELFQVSERVKPEYLQDAIKKAIDRQEAANRGRGEYRAELLRDKEAVDINARAEPGQPHYSMDPDVATMNPKGKNGIPIFFASAFDKAVYMLVRLPAEIGLYKAERRLFIEERMMQFAKKVGIPIKELEAHKAKLMQEVKRVSDGMDEQMREIGMEPHPEGAPRTPYLEIGTQAFEGARSKFTGMDWKKVGVIADATKVEELLNDNEKAIVAENKAAYDAMNRDIAMGRVGTLNDNGIILKMDGGSTVRAIDSNGKTVATFDNIEDALAFRETAINTSNTGRPVMRGDVEGGSGEVAPPENIGNSGDLGGSKLPPDAGNYPVDGWVDPYGNPNWMNMLTRWFSQIQGQYLKPRLAALRDFGAQYKMDLLRVGAGKFDSAAIRAAAESIGYSDRLSKIFKEAIGFGADRIKFVIGQIPKIGVADDWLSNMFGRRYNNVRASTPTEFNYWGKMVKLAKGAIHQGETPLDALHRALEAVKGLRKLDARYLTEEARQDPTYKRQIQQHLDEFVPNKSSQDLVDLVNEILSKDISEADLFQIIGMTESTLNGSVSKADFIAANKVSPKELKISKDMEAFINDIAGKHGFDGVYLQRIMDQISRIAGGTFDESVYSYQKGWNPEQLAFLKQLIRDPGNIAMDRDPFKMMHVASTTSVRSRVLAPARDEFLRTVAKELDAANGRAELESLRKKDNGREITRVQKATKRILDVVTDYTDEVMGKVDGFDYIVNDATNQFLNYVAKRLGSTKEFDVNIRKSVLTTISRVAEAAAQGARPKAGAADFLYINMKLLTEYPEDRYLKMWLITDKAIREATDLQKRGIIPGLNVIIPEDLSGPQTAQTFRVAKDLAIGSSEKLFKMSLQPQVYKLYAALIYTEAVGRVAKGVEKYGMPSDQPSMLKMSRYLTLDIFPEAIRKEFFRKLSYEGSESAGHYLGQEAQNHFLVQYGRGTHPYGWSSIVGRAFGTFGTWPLGAFDSFRQNLANREWRSMARWGAKTAGIYWLQHKIRKDTGYDIRGYSYNLIDWLTWRGSPVVGMGGAVADWMLAKSNGNAYKARQAEWQIRNFMPNGSKRKMDWLERMIPFSSDDPNWNSIVVPGSFGAQDAREAYKELREGDLMQAILRELSLRPSSARRGQ